MKATTINVPVPTLNALKQLLFTSDSEGVDLSSIVKDLGGNDLTAINVGLVFKGIKPKIEDASRYGVHYGNKFYRYDFKSYSLIKDEVICERIILKYNKENGDTTVDSSREEKLTYAQWMDLSPEINSVINEIVKG